MAIRITPDMARKFIAARDIIDADAAKRVLKQKNKTWTQEEMEVILMAAKKKKAVVKKKKMVKKKKK